MSRVRRSIALAALALFFGTAGCGHFRRVGECRRLAARVNGALEEISSTYDAGGATAPTYRDVAGRYERLAKDVESFAKEDDAFGRTLREYSSFFRDTAHVLTALADAMDHRDPGTIARIRHEMANNIRRDKTLAARVEGACEAP